MPINSILGGAEVADSTATAKDYILEIVQGVSHMSNEELFTWAISGLASIAGKIILAMIIYFVGAWLIKRLSRLLKAIFEARQVEISLSKFIINLVNISLTIILIFTTIGVLGINTTSFLALFASAGLAVGMALSGTLQNFAGGVLILFLKPFKIGDWIEAQGYAGTVKEISLFSTLLNTIDNKMVIIPNGGLSTEIINNYSKESTRRVQWNIGVSYGTNYKYAKQVIEQVLSENELIMHDEEIFIVLSELGDSSVNIIVRVWCRSEDYWTIYFSINEKIYERFNEVGVEFPFPQLDVHLKQK